MYDITNAVLHVDTPSPRQRLPAGRNAILGWLVPKPGFHYTDLRAVIGAKKFPGIFGLPRPDVASYFKAERSHLLAGFEIAVDLVAGRFEVILEGCTIGGAWERLDSFRVEAGLETGRPAISAGSGVPVRGREFGEALRILLRRWRPDDRPLHAEAVAIVQATPGPHYLRHAHLPFHGNLDEPEAWSRSVFGRVAITGWIFHETLPIKRVFATADLQAVQNLKFGRPTPFLADRYENTALAGNCGFDGFLDVPDQLPRPVAVRVYAELADGSWHLGFVVRIATTDHEFAKQPIGRISFLKFWRARRALLSEAAAAGLPVESGPSRWKEIARVWRENSARAPARSGTFAPAVPRTPRHAPPEKIFRLHLITHNLNREGAPLFLLEYARHLARETGAGISVTSGQDGPLRRDFANLGASVQVVDPGLLLAATSVRELRRALDGLAATVNLQEADLVVVNTLSAYWGVSLAHRAGRPVLFYIHESTTPSVFFRGLVPPAALAMVEETFRLADRVSFLTAATERYYAGLSGQSNYCITPGWIDVAGIDAFRATRERTALRELLRIAPGRKLVINPGTVCDRKGQHVFARAVDLLWRTAPDVAASAEFQMIGGRDTAYDLELADFLTELNRPNLGIVAETSDVYAHYGAADVFVCSSFEESFPRVVLEAMAFELPIVTTAAQGISELVRPDREALVVPPGDTAALSSAMRLVLSSPETSRTLARNARERVVESFDSRRVIPRHVALARTLAQSSG